MGSWGPPALYGKQCTSSAPKKTRLILNYKNFYKMWLYYFFVTFIPLRNGGLQYKYNADIHSTLRKKIYIHQLFPNKERRYSQSRFIPLMVHAVPHSFYFCPYFDLSPTYPSIQSLSLRHTTSLFLSSLISVCLAQVSVCIQINAMRKPWAPLRKE